MPKKQYKLPNSARGRVWRNMMVSAVNAGLEQGVFSLDVAPFEARAFNFEIDGLPALAYASMCFSGQEVNLKVAVCPNPDIGNGITTSNSKNKNKPKAGAFAHGFLEREKGKYFQQGGWSYMFCRRDLLDPLSKVQVDPTGYTDSKNGFNQRRD